MRETALERRLILILSILSLIPPLLIGFSSHAPQDDPSRGIVIAPAYLAICVLGVVAAFYPATCSRLLSIPRRRGDFRAERGLSSSRTLSHHPSCGGFQHHEFNLVGRRLCVGCTGMIVGAAASSVLVVAYFTRNPGPSLANHLLVAGVLLVALELTQTLLLDVERRALRFSLNVLFVIGVSAILIGEDMLRKSLQIDSYMLVLALFWLYVRIRSSQLNHERVCDKCDLVCPLDKSAPTEALNKD